MQEANKGLLVSSVDLWRRLTETEWIFKEKSPHILSCGSMVQTTKDNVLYKMTCGSPYVCCVGPCVCTHVWVCASLCSCVFACSHACLCVSEYVCMCVSYVCVRVCTQPPATAGERASHWRESWADLCCPWPALPFEQVMLFFWISVFYL